MKALRAGSACVLLGTVLVLTGCRDEPAFHEPARRAALDTTAVWRLTFNPGVDRAPVWSAGGDSVYYTATSFDQLPDTEGILLGMPMSGGVMVPLLSGIDRSGFQPVFTAPALSPDGDLLAYVEPGMSAPATLCPATVISCSPGGTDEFAIPPPLTTATIRVRELEAPPPPADDPALVVEFAGLEPPSTGDPYAPGGSWIAHHYPFQQIYQRSTTLIFRPSWAPDGDRVVFSDGLELRIWNMTTDEVVPVPGTQDGMSAAWSPDGEWIAFSRAARHSPTGAFCEHLLLDPRGVSPPSTSCTEQRIVYPFDAPLLTLVRPDGSGLRELGPGTEPAWGPDSRTIYYRDQEAIWRRTLDGDAAEVVPGTARGREPAISRDGDRLAFVRGGPASPPAEPIAPDIWVAALDSLF